MSIYGFSVVKNTIRCSILIAGNTIYRLAKKDGMGGGKGEKCAELLPGGVF